MLTSTEKPGTLPAAPQARPLVPPLLYKLFASRVGQAGLAALLLSVPYFLALWSWDFPACLDRLLFADFVSDSAEYLEFGQWLTGQGGQPSDARPYFFPLVLQLLLTAGGPLLVWLYHYVLYLGAGLLMKGIVARSTGPRVAWLALLAYGLCFTVAVLTLFALTEITTLFLLSLLAYFLTWPEQTCPLRRPSAFLCVSLLTVTKPAFTYLWVLFLLWLLCREGADLIRRRQKALLLLSGLTVVGIQLVLMKICFGSFFLSRIGEVTLRDYYYQRLYAKVQGIPFDDASQEDLARIWEATEEDRTSDMLAYSLRHLPQAMATLWYDVRSNIEAPTLLSYVVAQPPDLRLMWTMNRVIAWLHLAALFAVALLLVLNRFRLPRVMPGFLPAYFSVLYLLVISGASWGQGDRLTVFTITTWLAIYPALFAALGRRVWRLLLANGTRREPIRDTGVCTP
jgi:hypothetical protein